jgi:hypothetical protein
LSKTLAVPDSLTKRFFGLVLVFFLASCGGGGGGDGVSVPQDTVRVACTVADAATQGAVADADVNYQSGTTEFTTRTNAAGKCELDLPAAEVAGVNYPAATVNKDGYEPQTILCPKLQGGQSCTQSVSLVPLADNVSIPVGGDIVMHLGDDRFEGAANSQFQTATDSAQLTFAIADWAEKVQAGYTKATVYLDAKGWQTNQCQNTIALAGDAGDVSLPGGNSPADGYWGGGKQVPFDFNVSQVGTQSAQLRITSGSCNGTSDLDDFEINRIRVYFS